MAQPVSQPAVCSIGLKVKAKNTSWPWSMYCCEPITICSSWHWRCRLNQTIICSWPRTDIFHLKMYWAEVQLYTVVQVEVIIDWSVHSP
jgi:hypothetical protein